MKPLSAFLTGVFATFALGAAAILLHERSAFDGLLNDTAEVGRYTVRPVGEIKETGMGVQALAWRIDTVTGALAFCHYLSAPSEPKTFPRLSCVAEHGLNVVEDDPVDILPDGK